MAFVNQKQDLEGPTPDECRDKGECLRLNYLLQLVSQIPEDQTAASQLAGAHLRRHDIWGPKETGGIFKLALFWVILPNRAR